MTSALEKIQADNNLNINNISEEPTVTKVQKEVAPQSILESNPIGIKEEFEIKNNNKLSSTQLKSLEEPMKQELKRQYEAIKKQLEKTKKDEGFVSKAWGWFKNKTGLGQSLDKTQAELDELKKQIEILEKTPAKLSDVYKATTGKELDLKELQRLEKEGFNLKATQAVEKYAQGQNLALDIISDVAAGVAAAAMYTVALGGAVAAPFTGGASLGITLAAIASATVVGAAVKTSIKGADALSSGRSYTAKEFGKDAIMGAVNGPLTFATAGAGCIVANIGSKLGLNAAKTAALQMSNQAVVRFGKASAQSTMLQSSGFLSKLAHNTMQGACAGAVYGGGYSAAGYSVNCSFEDQEFKMGELFKVTATGSAFGAACGGILSAGGTSIAQGYRLAKGVSAPPGTARTETVVVNGQKTKVYYDSQGTKIAVDIQGDDFAKILNTNLQNRANTEKMLNPNAQITTSTISTKGLKFVRLYNPETIVNGERIAVAYDKFLNPSKITEQLNSMMQDGIKIKSQPLLGNNSSSFALQMTPAVRATGKANFVNTMALSENSQFYPNPSMMQVIFAGELGRIDVSLKNILNSFKLPLFVKSSQEIHIPTADFSLTDVNNIKKTLNEYARTPQISLELKEKFNKMINAQKDGKPVFKANAICAQIKVDTIKSCKPFAKGNLNNDIVLAPSVIEQLDAIKELPSKKYIPAAYQIITEALGISKIAPKLRLQYLPEGDMGYINNKTGELTIGVGYYNRDNINTMFHELYHFQQNVGMMLATDTSGLSPQMARIKQIAAVVGKDSTDINAIQDLNVEYYSKVLDEIGELPASHPIFETGIKAKRNYVTSNDVNSTYELEAAEFGNTAESLYRENFALVTDYQKLKAALKSKLCSEKPKASVLQTTLNSTQSKLDKIFKPQIVRFMPSKRELDSSSGNVNFYQNILKSIEDEVFSVKFQLGQLQDLQSKQVQNLGVDFKKPIVESFNEFSKGQYIFKTRDRISLAEEYAASEILGKDTLEKYAKFLTNYETELLTNIKNLSELQYEAVLLQRQYSEFSPILAKDNITLSEGKYHQAISTLNAKIKTSAGKKGMALTAQEELDITKQILEGQKILLPQSNLNETEAQSLIKYFLKLAKNQTNTKELQMSIDKALETIRQTEKSYYESINEVETESKKIFSPDGSVIFKGLDENIEHLDYRIKVSADDIAAYEKLISNPQYSSLIDSKNPHIPHRFLQRLANANSQGEKIDLTSVENVLKALKEVLSASSLEKAKELRPDVIVGVLLPDGKSSRGCFSVLIPTVNDKAGNHIYTHVVVNNEGKIVTIITNINQTTVNTKVIPFEPK